MSNQMDVRPWFRSDVADIVRGLDYLDGQRHTSEERRAGFLDALIALCLICGIDLADVGLDPDAIIEGQK